MSASRKCAFTAPTGHHVTYKKNSTPFNLFHKFRPFNLTRSIKYLMQIGGDHA
jgi:hypothetical protein